MEKGKPGSVCLYVEVILIKELPHDSYCFAEAYDYENVGDIVESVDVKF
ncbi:hypothetical protein JMUB7507_26470 [Staphylococcus aureus]